MTQASTAVKLADMQFRIVKPLGNGAGSSVLQINDTKKGGYYALKVVKRQGPTTTCSSRRRSRRRRSAPS